MASIDDIKKLLEERSLTSARDLDEMEEKSVKRVDSVILNCDPQVGKTDMDGNIVLKALSFSRAWNSLGKDIVIKKGNALPLGQGDMLEVDTGISAMIPEGAIGMINLLPCFLQDTGLTLVGSPFVLSNKENIKIKITNVRRDIAIVEKDKVVAGLILVGVVNTDIYKTYNSKENVRIEDSKE